MVDIASNAGATTGAITATGTFIGETVAFFVNGLVWIVKGIGPTEIIVFLVIVGLIFVWAKQHLIQPVKVRRF